MYKPIKEKIAQAERCSPRPARISLPNGKTGATNGDQKERGESAARLVEAAQNSPENRKGEKRKLILKNLQSPGDVVMLTAAIRDLHRSYPNQFDTDVHTSCGPLWENNPFVMPLDKNDESVEVIECNYPLIHRSNTGPWHFIHGFIQDLNETLDLQITPTDFKGDIHLAPQEKAWISQAHEIIGDRVPFWIITAGGKRDYTIKWWTQDRFQAVVNHFRERILFVQVGEVGHEHPKLEGVLDLRGKTDLRQLVRLVHHAQGIVCPVTLLMHLAAAVETREGMPKNRACVVIAGGREPVQWEAYPHHQFIHTNGALFCCDNGGCWKSRVVPLGDGDEKDKEENLCLNVVDTKEHKRQLRSGAAGIGKVMPNAVAAPKTALGYPKERWPQLLPKCMDMISPEEVIRRIEIYFAGGSLQYLSRKEIAACKRTIVPLGWKS